MKNSNNLFNLLKEKIASQDLQLEFEYEDSKFLNGIADITSKKTAKSLFILAFKFDHKREKLWLQLFKQKSNGDFRSNVSLVDFTLDVLLMDSKQIISTVEELNKVIADNFEFQDIYKQ